MVDTRAGTAGRQRSTHRTARRRSVAAGGDRRHLPRGGSLDRPDLTEVADATSADALQALDAASKAQPGWAAVPPRERSEILRRAYDLLTRTPGGPGAPDDAGDGQAAGRGAWRDRLRGGVLPLVLRGGRAHRRRVRRRAQRSGALPRDAPAGGSLPADHAVELPDGDGHPQDRPGGGGGLHDGGQAGGADPAVDAGARRHPPGGRAFPTACSTSSPPRTPAPSWSR